MYSQCNPESVLTGSQGDGAEAMFMRHLHVPGAVSPQVTISFVFPVPVHPPRSVVPGQAHLLT